MFELAAASSLTGRTWTSGLMSTKSSGAKCKAENHGLYLNIVPNIFRVFSWNLEPHTFDNRLIMGHLYKRKRKDRKGRVHESQVWWIQYYKNGRKYRESSGSTKRADAERLLRLREGMIARGIFVRPNIERIRFDELVEDLIVDYTVHGYSTFSDMKRRLDLHILPRFSGSFAASINRSHIMKFIASRQEEGASAASINRELSVVKRCFSLGVENS